MTEFGERRNTREIDIVETPESINQFILNAQKAIRRDLINQGLVLPRKEDVITPLPKGKRHPYPLQHTPDINGFNTPGSGNSEIYWKEKDGTSRGIILRLGDPEHLEYVLKTERPNPEGGDPLEESISYSDGGVFLDQTNPVIYLPSKSNELNEEGNEEIKEGWDDAKRVLTDV